jgi:Zn-dependent membrane protease YugP
MFFFDSTIVLLIPVLILAFYAQNKVKGNYQKYRQYRNSANLTGAEVARMILDRNGLHDVAIQPVKGELTDHYDPRKKVVSLSQAIYSGASISSASIAAHEVGHAIQHAKNYLPLTIRSSIVPIANIGTQSAFPLFFIGLIFSLPQLMDIGIIFFAAAFLFHIVTLPVEYNASQRAMAELNQGIIYNDQEEKGVKAVLNAAALTYVAATLMALVNLIRLILIRGSRS